MKRERVIILGLPKSGKATLQSRLLANENEHRRVICVSSEASPSWMLELLSPNAANDHIVIMSYDMTQQQADRFVGGLAHHYPNGLTEDVQQRLCEYLVSNCENRNYITWHPQLQAIEFS